MLPKNQNEDQTGNKPAQTTNTERHKKALRENLKKRKIQARDLGMKSLDGNSESGSDGPKIRRDALKPKMQQEFDE